MLRLMAIAWLQLSKEKLRLFIALAGVTFSVVLVAMQLGFLSSVYEGAIRYHRNLRYDLVMLSPKTPFIGLPESFSRRRLYQTLGATGVTAVTPIYLGQALWKNPFTFNARNIFIVGFDPTHDILAIPAVSRNLDKLKLPDVALFDTGSRPEFGPIPAAVRKYGSVSSEVRDRRITIIDLFTLGSSFGIDGNLVMSDLNFLRIFPEREPGIIDLGLIHINSEVDVDSVQMRLKNTLERDVLILTREQFIRFEEDYWSSTTPIGYIFGFGAIMGLIVGGVIVYQILFADVSEHLAEYATLKAVGYTNHHLSIIVLQEAAVLAGLGFIPGILISINLYTVTAEATRLPIEMTYERAIGVLLLTVLMCGVAGFMALRKLRSADPAEIFR
jgi:putative ABC transport system permease protein